MPTIVAGKNSYFTYGTLNLGSALSNEVSMALASDEIETSTLNSDWKSFIQGQSEVTLSASGIWDAGTAAANLDAILWGAVNGGGTRLYEYMPQGTAVGRIKYAGNAIATAYEISSPVADRVGFTVSLRGSDTPVRTITI